MDKATFEHITGLLKEIIAGSEFENHVFCVGGSVRDMVMGNEIKDIDLVVDLQDGGIRFPEWLESKGLLSGTIVKYPSYGTAMFRLAGCPDVELECVQTRKEKYTDRTSRKPATSYGTLTEDCMRRDLTINALYYSITDGKITDPCGNGLADIRNHILRTTGTPDDVYDDDPLRILRCIRFFCKMNKQDGDWRISEDTVKGMEKNAFRLVIISRERIYDELCKMIAIDFPTAIFLMHRYRIIQYVFAGTGITGDQWHTAIKETQVLADWYEIYDKQHPASIPDHVALAVLLAGRTDSRKARTVLNSLKFPNITTDAVAKLMDAYPLFMEIKDSESLHRLQFRIGTTELWLELCGIAIAKTNNIVPDEIIVSEIIRECNEDFKNGTSMFGYRLPVNGNDIMDIRNIGKSKEVGLWLQYAMGLAFKNPLISRDEMIETIKAQSPDILMNLS